MNTYYVQYAIYLLKKIILVLKLIMFGEDKAIWLISEIISRTDYIEPYQDAFLEWKQYVMLHKHLWEQKSGIKDFPSDSNISYLFKISL